MSARTKSIAVFFSGFILGCAVISAAAYYYAIRPWWDLAQSSYLSAASRGVENVVLLQKLHSNDVAGASQLMEGQVTADALVLIMYAGVSSANERDPGICKGASVIRDYRASYPDQASSEDLRRTMQEGLQMKCRL